MLQRNTTGSHCDVPGIDHTVAPGEVIDHERPIPGFAPEKPAKKTTAAKKTTPATPEEN